MRRIFLLLMALMWSATVCFAAGTPNCIMLKFTDDTRFDRLQTANELSDDVMIKLLNSGKFSLSKDYPIDADIKTHLYDEKVRGYEMMESAFENDDFDAVFEEMINGRNAQSIATAQVGQIVSPELTSKIGKKNHADYLIQGTIINLGVGNWLKEDYSAMSRAINMASTFTGMSGSTSLLGMSNQASSLASFDVKKSGIGVQCDVRLIKASTGEIVWSKRVLGVATQKMIDTGIVKLGRAKLNDELRSKALDIASDNIVAALIDDLEAGKLFLR